MLLLSLLLLHFSLALYSSTVDLNQGTLGKVSSSELSFLVDLKPNFNLNVNPALILKSNWLTEVSSTICRDSDYLEQPRYCIEWHYSRTKIESFVFIILFLFAKYIVNIYIHKVTCGSVRPSETNASPKRPAFLSPKGPEILVFLCLPLNCYVGVYLHSNSLHTND